LQAHGLDASRMVAEQRPPITMREGAHSMQIMLEKWPDTEALMCVSDLSAFGAMTECQRQGLRVPDDIAIGGFGAYDLSEQSLPPITTIDVSSEAIGRIAAEVIQNLLSEDAGKDVSRVTDTIHHVEPRLLVRDSSRRRT
jgi:LacI family gluconate utilization system Gnt-I transcriptional repressor